MKKQTLVRGFTLLELLVVISIIGMMSSIVLAALGTAREKAKVARAQSDIAQIAKAIAVAQSEQGKPLYFFATTDCGQCSCADITSAACSTFWNTALSQIQAATNGIYTDLTTKFARDPWGNPYIIDANQGQGWNPANCGLADSLYPYTYSANQNIFPKIPLSGICL